MLPFAIFATGSKQNNMEGIKAAVYRLVFNRKGVALTKEGKSLIQVEIYYLGIRRYISTGIYIGKEQWNRKEKLIQKHSNALNLNLFLKKKVAGLMELEHSIRNEGNEFTLKSFDMILKGRDRKNLIEYMTRQIAQRMDIVRITRAQHEMVVRRLNEFGKIVLFRDLTYSNVTEFDNWLIGKGFMQSTVHLHHKIVKIYMYRAIASGLMDGRSNPYLKFKTKKGGSNERKYLTAEEVEKIEKQEFTGRIAIIRDLFLFSCYTGLAYSDAANLTMENIEYESGEAWIKTKRVKTDNESVIMLLPKAALIIEQYKGYKKGKLLPYITNQKMNDYLKTIADISGVKKELTTHVARHTFATTITLMNGVSLEVVQRMLGHSSIKTTEIYAKIVKERIKNEMTELRSKIS
jgi:site-specific recombinase XerD